MTLFNPTLNPFRNRRIRREVKKNLRLATTPPKETKE